MEIVLDAHLVWNVILTLLLGPLGFLVRNILSEQKRIDILLNKTREEVAKDYVTRDELAEDMERLMRSIERIDAKIDRLQNRTYFQD
jgi:division protein CdvB (Snf7/Vps24/ESCRT-III family)